MIRLLVAAAAHQSVILLNLLCLKIIFIKMLILIVYSMKFLLHHHFFLVKDIQIPYSSVPHIRIYHYLIQVKKRVCFHIITISLLLIVGFVLVYYNNKSSESGFPKTIYIFKKLVTKGIHVEFYYKTIKYFLYLVIFRCLTKNDYRISK